MRSLAGTAALAGIPAIVSSCISSGKKEGDEKYSLFQQGGTVLFQGDSITDARREKEKQLPNSPDSFGSGYAFLAASKLLNSCAAKDLTIYNRGISGNKVFQLAERWDKDCLDLNPDVLSILIGVNDYWHMRNNRYDGTVEVYENDYRALLRRTKDSLPDTKLVICQPFVVVNTSAVDESWVEPMKEYQVVAKKLADEFSTIWIPFQEVFDEALKYAPGVYWTADGVHPSMAGAQLMAEAWLKAVE
ncbi:MAG: SGNH/GDSL hydrolase family protein [Prolixibacteraceae bacterium]|nr:SGNH/GDSL hydrolase family protein [Prolixibacteraceae bacterium]